MLKEGKNPSDPKCNIEKHCRPLTDIGQKGIFSFRVFLKYNEQTLLKVKHYRDSDTKTGNRDHIRTTALERSVINYWRLKLVLTLDFCEQSIRDHTVIPQENILA